MTDDGSWAGRHDARVSDLLREIGQDWPMCGFYVGPGWLPHVAEALRSVAALEHPWVLEQVKQKFCQLRIYYSFPAGTPDVVRAEFERAVGIAAALCDAACEICGATVAPGAALGRKLCDPCRESRRR